MGGILSAIEVSAQGLSTQRAKMDVIAQNMANAETVETKEGGPYRRQRLVVSEDKPKMSFSSVLSKTSSKLARTHPGHRYTRAPRQPLANDISSVRSETVVDKDSSFRLVHDPGHPHADAEGFVRLPDIDVVTEMVDMMAASRAYEANTTVISAAKKMAGNALEI